MLGEPLETLGIGDSISIWNVIWLSCDSLCMSFDGCKPGNRDLHAFHLCDKEI